MPSPSSSLASLNNATDYKHHPSNVYNLPVLHVVMFTDPPVVAPMSPTASSAQGGLLAICAGCSANPSDTAIDKRLLNYTYKAAPMTKLSDISIRFRRLFAWRKCGSMHHPPKSVAIICSRRKALRRLHSEEQCKILQRAYSEELPQFLTLSLNLQVMAKENASLHSSNQTSSLVEGVSAHRVRQLYAQVNSCNLITIVDSGADLLIFGVGWCILHDWDDLFFFASAFFSSDTDEVACRLVTAAAVLYFPGTNIKRIHFHMNFDLCYFDYCAEHIADVHNNLSNRSIGSAVPLQVLTGVTPDISAFQIPFWKHCWYWDPHIKWPQHQWCKGHCLGRAKNVGDPFTYWIIPERGASCHK
jgi:hypothetical protein